MFGIRVASGNQRFVLLKSYCAVQHRVENRLKKGEVEALLRKNLLERVCST
jgi:hypothetical protein